MLAQNNEYLQEVVSGVRQLTEEEKIRQQCDARETNAYWERIREADRQNTLNTIAAQVDTIIAQTNTIAEQTNTIAEQANTITEQAAENARLRALLEQNGIKH